MATLKINDEARQKLSLTGFQPQRQAQQLRPKKEFIVNRPQRQPASDDNYGNSYSYRNNRNYNPNYTNPNYNQSGFNGERGQGYQGGYKPRPQGAGYQNRYPGGNPQFGRPDQQQRRPKPKRPKPQLQKLNPEIACRIRYKGSVQIDLIKMYTMLVGPEEAFKLFDPYKRKFFVNAKKRKINIISLDRASIDEVKANKAFMSLMLGITQASNRIHFAPFFSLDGSRDRFNVMVEKRKAKEITQEEYNEQLKGLIQENIAFRKQKREEREAKKAAAREAFLEAQKLAAQAKKDAKNTD